MHIRLSVRDPDGFGRDIALSAPPGTSVGDVSDGIAGMLPIGWHGAAELWSGSRRLPPGALLGGPGLRSGDVLHVGGAGQRDLTAGAVLRLHVVGGPDAGLIAPLPRGVVTLGRGPSCDLRLTDPDVSRQHAAITVTTVGITVRDLGSTNGTLLDGEPVEPDGSPVQPGRLLRLGDSLLCIAGADEPAAATRPTADGTRLVNRPPRLSASLPPHELAMPARPSASGPQRVQWLAALLPALAGCGLALAMHNIEFLAFALLSPVVIIGTAAGDRLHWRRDRRRAAISFRRRDAAARRERATLLAAEIAHRRRAHPDPAAVLRTATIPDCRLWERRRRDPDMLDVRLGVADQQAALRIRAGSEVDSAGVLSLVPSHVDLRSGPLGIAGPRGIALGTARWVVTQVSALHSPADVELALVLSDDAAPAWTWSRWLPHLQGRVACTPAERAAMVAGLVKLIDERLADRRLDPAGWPGPWLVLVVDRSGALADIPGLARVFAAGSAVGVTAVCLDDEERRLPTSCLAVARVCGETGTRLAVEVAGSGTTEVIADRVGTRWADQIARALAPLADASTEATGAIPASCRLLDLLELNDVTPEALAARWGSGHRPRTPLGIAAHGTFTVDLVNDGPHTLVAGTTGSGKSELLQSLIAGLAVSNSPADLAFVLIDYKGGAAFADCARLPHSAGLVTDLDPHLTQRALQSLDAELRRRESLFALAAAKDIEAYRTSPHQASAPLGRLLLVVDEFAALAEELPDFVTGLVGIAQRGRSLGVHLILATQRPGGVISPEIRANTTLRIALRVTDPAESSDVIGTDVAVSVDKHRPGRAFVRSGGMLTEIQTARVSAPAASGGAQALVIPLDEWGRSRRVDHSDDNGKTDLQLLVDALCEAATRSGVASPHRPWVPALPEALATTALSAATPSTIPLGLVDLPDEQRQSPLLVDLRAGGSMSFVGGPRSGRSYVLRTLGVTGAARLSAEELHLYVIDCAGGGLRSLRALPHCGAVATRDDFAAVARLLARLAAEVARRQALIAEQGLGSITEARYGESHLVVLFDGWEGFVAASDDYDAGRSVDVFLSLLREAASVGLTIAVTGDRTALAARLAGNVTRRFVLHLADRGDYALAGLSLRAVPGSMPPGRAVRADSGHEVQFAFLGSDPSMAEQTRVTSETAASTPPARPGRGPFAIRPLPRLVRRAEFGAASGAVLLGVGGDAAEAVSVDLFAGDARLLVAGPARSGRTMTLRLILEQMLGSGVPICVAAPKRSALAAAASAHGIEVILPDDGSLPTQLTVARPLLLVDDSEAFLDTPAGDALTELLKGGADGLAAVVAARSEDLAVTYRGVGSEARRSRAGLLLQPGPGDGELLGVRLPRIRTLPIPGRGVLVLDQPRVREVAGGSDVLAVQVALPETPTPAV